MGQGETQSEAMQPLRSAAGLQQRHWGESNMSAAQWFETAEDFRQCCLDAIGSAYSESAEEFSHEMMLAAQEQGLLAPLSERQAKWLCQIADWPAPLKRS